MKIGESIKKNFRFRGKESFLYMKHFPSLIRMLLSNVTSKAVKKRLIEVHLQSIYLRKILSYAVRITDFNTQNLIFMKKTAKGVFKICCVFDFKISPSLWTVQYVMPHQPCRNFPEKLWFCSRV